MFENQSQLLRYVEDEDNFEPFISPFVLGKHSLSILSKGNIHSLSWMGGKFKYNTYSEEKKGGKKIIFNLLFRFLCG